MKNIVRNSFALMCFSALLFLASCEKDNLDETTTVTSGQTAPARMLGEWEHYKREVEELILEFEDGEMVQSMEWIDLTSSMANELTLEFYEDLTFSGFYAGVETHQGAWSEENDSTFIFTFDEYPWSDLTETYVVNFHCDSTMSIKFRVEPPAGNNDFQDEDWYEVSYFRAPGTTQCDDLIDYYVGSFDCEGLALNFGDVCEGEGFTGAVSADCECVESSSFDPDCPEFYFEGWSDGNYGSPCETPGVPQYGIIGDDCECIEDPSLDCPGLGNIGDYCAAFNQDGLAYPGTVGYDCECLEETIEGRWLWSPGPTIEGANTMYEYSNGVRYTYYCGTAECDEAYWNSLEISDAIPGTENYTFEDGVLTVDLNFGNELVTPLTFECDGNQVNFVTPGYSLYRIGSDCD